MLEVITIEANKVKQLLSSSNNVSDTPTKI